MAGQSKDGLEAARALDRCLQVEVEAGRLVVTPSALRLRADLALRNFEARFADDLNEDHKKFARFYVNSGYNAEAAAIAAELPSKDATKKERRTFISAMLSHVYVQEYMRLYSEADMHFRLRSTEDAVRELEHIAFSRPSDYMEELPNGLYRVKLNLADGAKMAAVSKMKTVAVPVFTADGKDDGTVAGIQIEFHDKIAALKEVMKFHERRESITTAPQLLSGLESLPRATNSDAPRQTSFKVVITPVPTGFFIPAPTPPHEAPTD